MATLMVVVALLAGCAPALPYPPDAPVVPELMRSPLPVPEQTQRLYLPLLAVPAMGKRGVGVANGVCMPGVAWHYEWRPQPVRCEDSLAIPMVYCGPDWTGLPLTYSGPLLAMNEPDRADQCNLAPIEGARQWRELELRFPRAQLIGPAVSQDGAAWLRDWHDAYQRMYNARPRIYALAVHCYWPAEKCVSWTRFNLDLAQQWTSSGRVWVTEFAGLPSWYDGPEAVAQALAEGEAFRAWLEAEPGVAAYAWFVTHLRPGEEPWGPRSNTSLVGPDGRLTVFGEWYRAAGR